MKNRPEERTIEIAQIPKGAQKRISLQTRTAINLRNVDGEVHRAFRTEVTRRGRSMTGVLVAFMREFVEESSDLQSENPNRKRLIDIGSLLGKYRKQR